MSETGSRVGADEEVAEIPHGLVYLFQPFREFLVCPDQCGKFDTEEWRRLALTAQYQPAQQRHGYHEGIDGEVGTMSDPHLPPRWRGLDRRNSSDNAREQAYPHHRLDSWPSLFLALRLNPILTEYAACAIRYSHAKHRGRYGCAARTWENQGETVA
jgi:hypothetical protein